MFSSKYPLLKDCQLERYLKHQGETRNKVLIAIGIGGEPDSPARVYLVPLDTIRQRAFNSEDELASFRLENPKGGAAQYIDNYFSDVFSKSKRH